MKYGAGDGNRTHVASLEGWSFTIKLHPQIRFMNDAKKTPVNLTADQYI
jgi:hypothetical protein